MNDIKKQLNKMNKNIDYTLRSRTLKVTNDITF
jgi:hypothetical protein